MIKGYKQLLTSDINLKKQQLYHVWPRGPMDKASDYESGYSRFESWRGQLFFLLSKEKICLTNQSGYFTNIHTYSYNTVSSSKTKVKGGITFLFSTFETKLARS